MISRPAAGGGFRVIQLAPARPPADPPRPDRDRYTLVLPLGWDGRIDAEQCRLFPGLCKVGRRLDDGTVRTGAVRPAPGEAWVLDFGDAGVPAEAGLRFSEARFVAGAVVSIQREDGEQAYQVVSLQPL